ncbi:HTH domain-containing protein [Haloarcula sp. H-GB5]
MERERDEQGRYTGQIAPQDVLNILRESDTPVMTAKQVADKLGCTREAARQKLESLYQEERVEKMKVGARAVVWWRNTNE